MLPWEYRIIKADNIIFSWMRTTSKIVVTPEDCMPILHQNDIYVQKRRDGLPFRNDLRKMRELHPLPYETGYLRYEQEHDKSHWFIFLSVLRHILYEIEMYQLTFYHLLKEKDQGQFKFNVMFESHVLHLRNIFKFFNGQKNNTDDVIYSDIIGKSDDKYNTYSEYLKNEKIINKCIMHISFLRNEHYSRNNLRLFFDCFFSGSNSLAFLGFGQIINDFLNELIDIISNNCAKDIEETIIYKLIVENLKENQQLLSLKDKIIFQ